jgi:hypothetical protein
VTLPRHLETDPWVDPQFFAHRWSQEYAEEKQQRVAGQRRPVADQKTGEVVRTG